MTRLPARFNDIELARVRYAASRRGLTYKAFITKLLARRFTLPEQAAILRELGSTVVDKLFDACEYFARERIESER